MSLNIHITAATAENPEDVISLNMPAFLRCLEIAREQIKDDNELHMFVEALHAKQGDPPLTTEDISVVESESGISKEDEESPDPEPNEE